MRTPEGVISGAPAVEAEAAAGERDAARSEAGMLAGVGDLIDGVAAQERRGGRLPSGSSSLGMP